LLKLRFPQRDQRLHVLDRRHSLLVARLLLLQQLDRDRIVTGQLLVAFEIPFRLFLVGQCLFQPRPRLGHRTFGHGERLAGERQGFGELQRVRLKQLGPARLHTVTLVNVDCIERAGHSGGNQRVVLCLDAAGDDYRVFKRHRSGRGEHNGYALAHLLSSSALIRGFAGRPHRVRVDANAQAGQDDDPRHGDGTLGEHFHSRRLPCPTVGPRARISFDARFFGLSCCFSCCMIGPGSRVALSEHSHFSAAFCRPSAERP